MNLTLKTIAVAGGVLSLMVTGALAGSTAADENQAGRKATKQASPTSGMKAENRSEGKEGIKGDSRSEGKERSAMKGDEHRDRASVHARGDSQSKERTRITSETDHSARIHRYSYNTGPDVSIRSRYHRHYVYNEPDSYLIYKRQHRHHVYGYEEPSVTIRSSHRHVYSEGEKTSGTYVSGRNHTEARVTARTETSERAGGAHRERGSANAKTENGGPSKMSKPESGGRAAANANPEKSSGHKQSSAEAGNNKRGGSRQGS